MPLDPAQLSVSTAKPSATPPMRHGHSTRANFRETLGRTQAARGHGHADAAGPVRHPGTAQAAAAQRNPAGPQRPDASKRSDPTQTNTRNGAPPRSQGNGQQPSSAQAAANRPPAGCSCSPESEAADDQDEVETAEADPEQTPDQPLQQAQAETPPPPSGSTTSDPAADEAPSGDEDDEPSESVEDAAQEGSGASSPARLLPADLLVGDIPSTPGAAHALPVGASDTSAAGAAAAAGSAVSAASPAASAAARTSEPPASAAPHQPPTPPTIQVGVSLLRSAMGLEQQVFTMKLQPGHLGAVDVRLEVDRQGRAHASFAVERKDTLQMLQQDAHHLVATLKQAGLAADASSLSFGLKDAGEDPPAFGQERRTRRAQTAAGGSDGAHADDQVAVQPPVPSNRLYDIHA